MERDEVATVPDPEAACGIAPADLASARYDIERSIGRGGMGEVFLARDRTIGREVAIKRMLDPNASSRALARFFREAQIQGRLDHPSVVPVHELGVDADGRPFIVMKRLAGRTLRQCLDAPRQVLLRAFVDVCLAVEYAHTRGVVHRDLKPENIVLGDFGEVYVLDWGVAKLIADTDIDIAVEITPNDEHVTHAGAAVGTPGYMSPEQARGERDIDARADVYALGCILFEILTGREAFMLRAGHVDGDIPVELDALCGAALAEDRAQRLPSARELATGVQAYLDGDRDLERRRQLASVHLATARAALAAGDRPEQRSVAMREAGRSLALDPTATEAADLIGKLMIEAPVTPPAEVERAIETERLQRLRRNARAAAAALVGVILLTVLVYAKTAVSGPHVLVIDGIAVGFLALTGWAQFTARLRPWVPVIVAVGLALMVALFAHMFPPFMTAPAIAALSVMAAPYTMQYPPRWFSAFLTVLMLIAIGVPYLAEAAGAIEPTFSFRPEGILLHTPALQGSPAWQIAIAALYIVAALSFAGWMGFVTQQNERGARRQLHLQAWHLRQLVSR